MKRVLAIIITVFCATHLWAQGNAMIPAPTKQTHLYAVKGADSLYLDHHIAPIEGKRPCVIFVFGGGFAGGARDRDHKYFQFLTDNGYDVVSIDYRLGMKNASSPGVVEFLKLFKNTVNMAVEDLFCATNFILDHADEWQIDTTKIVASGTSAGAITSLQAEYAICNNLPIAATLHKGFNYAGIIAFAGAVFTTEGRPQWNGKSAPTLMFHGSSDTNVPYNKMALFGIGMYGSKYISEQLHEESSPYWLYAIEYEDHYIASKPMHHNQREILIFLDEYVAQQQPLQRTTLTIDGNVPKRKTFFLPTDFINSNY